MSLRQRLCWLLLWKFQLRFLLNSGLWCLSCYIASIAYLPRWQRWLRSRIVLIVLNWSLFLMVVWRWSVQHLCIADFKTSFELLLTSTAATIALNDHTYRAEVIISIASNCFFRLTWRSKTKQHYSYSHSKPPPLPIPKCSHASVLIIWEKLLL